MTNCDSVSLQSFNADPGIDLWWNEKTRRINQHQRKQYKSRCCTNSSTDNEPCTSSSLSTTEDEAASSIMNDVLSEWDDWLQNDSDSDSE